MKTIKKITIALLLISLVSCKGPKIKPQIVGELSFHFDRCLLVCFDIMNAKVTNPNRCNKREIPEVFPDYYSIELNKKKREYLKFNEGKYPLEVCDGFTGFFIDDYAAKIKPWAKKTINYYKNKGE